MANPSPERARRPCPLRPLFEVVYRVVDDIPEGTVATYGQIADLAGTGPRLVGQALAALPEGRSCPWHRVVNARGRISVRAEDPEAERRQRRRLTSEGVRFRGGRVDLVVYLWTPEREAACAGESLREGSP